MTDLFELTPTREATAANDLKLILDQGEGVDRKVLNAAMAKAFGQSDACGAWTQRQSFEVLELATTLHLRGQGRAIDADYVRYAARLAESLPTQTVRSEDQSNGSSSRRPPTSARWRPILRSLSRATPSWSRALAMVYSPHMCRRAPPGSSTRSTRTAPPDCAWRSPVFRSRSTTAR